MLLTHELLSQAESVFIPSRRRAVYRRGERTGTKKGASLEFSDYREYFQGDDLRSIDWNVYARTERLFLKLFLEEQSKPVYFIIDASESMKFGTPSKFEFAKAFAGLLSYASLRHYDRPQIILARGKQLHHFPVPSRKAFFSLYQRLDRETCEGALEWNVTMRRIASSRLPRGVFFLLSDFYSHDDFGPVKTLAATGNDIHCLQILSPEEIDPVIRGDLRLLDCEISEKSEVSITAAALRKYKSALDQLQSRIKAAASAAGGTFYCISSSTDLGRLVFRQLRASGVLA